MPITWLDVILIVVMLISAFLAMLRGLTRETLSIASWGAAAGAALYVFKYQRDRFYTLVQDYIDTPIIAHVAIAATVFLLVLIVVHIITILISDRILDSRIGAIDRTLGFAFGLARGALLVVIAFKLYVLIVPKEKMPEWVATAYSVPMLESTSKGLLTLLPDDLEAIFRKKDRQESTSGD